MNSAYKDALRRARQKRKAGWQYIGLVTPTELVLVNGVSLKSPPGETWATKEAQG